MSLFNSIQENAGKDVMSTIYNKVNELFGAGNQLFAMEFPTRPLNPLDFEYEIKDSFSSVTKPYSVQEAEFLLSDSLYDCYPVVQGPNGERLSTVYDTIINNFVPRLESMSAFVNDQKQLREWLLSPSDVESGDDNANLSRMELCKKLYKEYLVKKNKWNRKKSSVYDGAKSGEGSNLEGAEGIKNLDDYTKWLSSQGLVEEESLNNLFNDAVVKGHYHEVLTLLGYLNVASPAETLETTKQKMRASMRRSLDGSTDVYPVNFTPSNWFKSLAPNISPKDLTMAKEQLVMEFAAKQKMLRNMQQQLIQLNAVHVSPDDLDSLKIQIDEAEKNLSKAEIEMVRTHGAGAYNAFKAVYNIYQSVKSEKSFKEWSGSDENKEEIGGFGLAEELIDDMVKSYQKIQENLGALDKLNEARMAYSEAKVRDMSLQKQKLEEKIRNVQADIDFLSPLVSGVISHSLSGEGKEENEEIQKFLQPLDEAQNAYDEAVEKGGKTPNEDAKKDISDKLTALNEAKNKYEQALNKSGGGILSGDAENSDSGFTDIIITEEISAEQESKKEEASASQDTVRVGFWFFSKSHQNHQSSASSEQKSKSSSFKVEIGFRARKVSIDRGGWFNPNILKMTQNFFRLTDTIVSPGTNKNAVQTAAYNDTQNPQSGTSRLDKLVSYPCKVGNETVSLRHTLPSYPMAFVIAKDITIKISSQDFATEATKSEMASSTSKGGGFFCFGSSNGSSNKSSSESSYSGFKGNTFYMRIPGPQILGWFLQFTPPDVSEKYEHIDTNMYSKTAQKAQNDLIKQISAGDETKD